MLAILSAGVFGVLDVLVVLVVLVVLEVLDEAVGVACSMGGT